MIVHLLVADDDGENMEWREMSIRPSSIVSWYVPDISDIVEEPSVVVDTLAGMHTLRQEEPLLTVLKEIREEQYIKIGYYEQN